MRREKGEAGPVLSVPSQGQLRRWTSLTRKGMRRREGLTLAEGLKVVRELLVSPWHVEAILVLKGREDLLEGLPGTGARAPLFRLTEGEWRRLTQDPTPEGIMAVAGRPRGEEGRRTTRDDRWVVLAPGIGNPSNLGALIRTMHWFGVTRLVLGKGSVDAASPKVIRTSMGSVFHLLIEEGVDFQATLPRWREERRLIAAVPRGGRAPHAVGEPAALLLGNETWGLSDELLGHADELWTVPGEGGADSLSLPQAAAILLYELWKGGRR